MNKAQNPELLAHYTQIPVLFDVLQRKKLVLGNYSNWDDKSDVAILNAYAHKEQVRVLCFKELNKSRQDSIHHWKAYAEGFSGCRIDFNYEKLNQAANAIKATLGRVEYTAIGKFPKKINLPFTKRASYEGEKEWRIVWRGNLKEDKEISIKKGMIDRITFSSKMPESLFERIKSFLKLKTDFNISRSAIYENERWEKAALTINLNP